MYIILKYVKTDESVTSRKVRRRKKKEYYVKESEKKEKSEENVRTLSLSNPPPPNHSIGSKVMQNNPSSKELYLIVQH